MTSVAPLRPAVTASGRQHGLWILPEVWKAPKRTGPSHTSLDGAKSAAHRLHRPLHLIPVHGL